MKLTSLKFPNVELYVNEHMGRAVLWLQPSVGLESENLMQCLTAMVRLGYCKPCSDYSPNRRPGWRCYVFRQETP